MTATENPIEAAAELQVEGASRSPSAWRDVLRDRKALIGATVITLFVLLAVVLHTGGCGCCHGRGQMFTWRCVKCLPSQLNGPSWWLSAFLMRSIASQ